jgi:hypothetical protein
LSTDHAGLLPGITPIVDRDTDLTSIYQYYPVLTNPKSPPTQVYNPAQKPDRRKAVRMASERGNEGNKEGVSSADTPSPPQAKAGGVKVKVGAFRRVGGASSDETVKRVAAGKGAEPANWAGVTLIGKAP